MKQEQKNQKIILVPHEVLRLISSTGVVSSDKERIVYNDLGYENTWTRWKEGYFFTESDLKTIISEAFEAGQIWEGYAGVKIKEQIPENKEEYISSIDK